MLWKLRLLYQVGWHGDCSMQKNMILNVLQYGVSIPVFLAIANLFGGQAIASVIEPLLTGESADFLTLDSQETAREKAINSRDRFQIFRTQGKEADQTTTPGEFGNFGLLEDWETSCDRPCDDDSLETNLQSIPSPEQPTVLSVGMPAAIAQTTPPSPPTQEPLPPLPDVQPTPPEEEQPPVLTPPEEQPSPEESPDVAIPIRQVNVTGSTVLTDTEIQTIVAEVEGQTVSLDRLRQVADQITQIYLDRGYITSRAVLGDQVIEDGIVEIQVIEGTLAAIEVEGNNRVRDSYIRSRIELGGGAPLNTARLEDQLRLLRLDPLFQNIEASLRAGDEIAQSILTVRVQEANPFGLNLGVDNLSPPSVGSERLGGTVRYRNVTGFGDEISASYYWGTGDSQIYDLSYRIPVNAMNGTLGFRVAPNQNGIIQDEFRALNIEGESQLYEVSFRQPWVRSPRQEFATSLGFTFQESQTFVDGEPFGFGSGPSADGITRTSTFKLGADYLRRDVQGAWSVRSLLNIGTGLFDATDNDDSIPDGQFLSWISQVQRVQRLGGSQLLIIQADLQLSPHSLLSSQQFVIGGGQSLRGYRQNVRSGDNGFRLSVEDRIVILRDTSGIPIFQFAPFLDVGTVWNHVDNPNELPRQTFLAGIGMGVLWQIFPSLNVRIDYGRPIFQIDDKGTNAQDEGFYFTVNYQL
ncbi:ShlB/FhaC/HecB family hemolysin secretion/activation protein [Phormidium pseudopriestleyi FRX01]|uniref:ShlB/FhaC/HecB family hemolysin secretion/activation protein n=2 Tax=Phormidium TaxID=1198 RepID=A0ABS3FTN8_9CYAN|nr:ShlB/FhaC/HecB family hemolysin secretion/activation protein [Phormidium pseudopriestleyi]MBO0350497.1 ShlB/FhaC/HecB family hemolysin secretion/activation protein [Phormidium pseudopriestleyi FRX01]